MRLSHSISITFLVSTLAALPACSSEESSDDGGSGTGGTAGTATGGTGGAATGGAGGAATGGASGAATGGSGGGGVVDHPGSSQAEIEAFLMMETYKTTGMGWRPEATPGDPAASLHGATRRYFNETIIASKAMGNRPPQMGQHLDGSMSIKEILEGTTVIGKAATLRAGTMNIYYCRASVAGRCGMNTMADVALYATTTPSGACACHGSGTNPSHDAIPAP